MPEVTSRKDENVKMMINSWILDLESIGDSEHIHHHHISAALQITACSVIQETPNVFSSGLFFSVLESWTTCYCVEPYIQSQEKYSPIIYILILESWFSLKDSHCLHEGSGM